MKIVNPHPLAITIFKLPPTPTPSLLDQVSSFKFEIIPSLGIDFIPVVSSIAWRCMEGKKS